MKLDDVDGSDFAIEDRRGRGGAVGRGAKVGLPALIIAVIGILLSQGGGGGGGGGLGDLSEVLGQLDGSAAPSQQVPAATDGSDDAQVEFVADVGTLLEEHWAATFSGADQAFRPARVVVFDAPTDTGGCGIGQPEFGPFYCPASEQIFIDFEFYEQLEARLGFDGDFAMAYVLAHEYGHHIQHLFGIDDQVRQVQAEGSEAEANAASVDLELQADCLAGVWARSVAEADRLEAGDFDEAIDAAEAVGDDAIAERSGVRANQESFTHGTSADRKRWFRTGFDTADVASCDTFG